MKILVVDDEKMIRIGIITILSKAGLAGLEMEEARSGEEALNKAKENTYDLIISDIKMQNMNGIQLLKAVSQLPSKPEFIIISGYGEFEYAKDAIKYGAKAYMLKPVNKQELIENVTKLYDEKKKKEVTYMRQLQYMLMGEEHEEQVVVTHEKSSSESTYYTSLIKSVSQGTYEHTTDTINYLANEISQFAMNQSMEMKVAVEGKHIVLVCEKEGLDRALFESLPKNERYALVLICSDEKVPMDEIRNETQRLLDISDYYKLFKKPVILYSQVKNRKEDYEHPTYVIKQLTHMVHTGKADTAHKRCHQIFNKIALETYSITYFRLAIQLIAEELILPVLLGLPTKHEDIKERYEKLASFDDIDDLQMYLKLLEGFIDEISLKIKTIKQDKIKQEKMDKALKFIEQNFDNKDMNMAMVSNNVSLNYSYFSQVFKEEVGINFVEYLNKYRIEKAKELLARSELKVYEISDSIGYHDAKRFLKVFKEVEGLSPLEYRKKYHYENVAQ